MLCLRGRTTAHLLGAAGFLNAVLFGAASARAVAGEEHRPVRWREVSAGADATSHVWLLYSSSTISPFGGIFDNGLRLRFSGGYGGYRYSAPPGASNRSFKATTAFSDVLVGYAHRLGPLTAKAFVGAAIIGHDIRPLDDRNEVQGNEYGPKAVAELWLNLGSQGWASIDLNWTSAHETSAARLRAGYRLLTNLSAGLELGVNTNAESKDGRGGGFLRYEWDGAEISVSGGISGDIAQPTNPYATINWVMQY